MFRQLIEVWKGDKTLLDEVVSDFHQMLAEGHKMFDQVTTALFEGKEMGDLRKNIYKDDAGLNVIEQMIRRRIVSQLAGKEEGPIATCLILMSISKDAERIGDYVKNILAVFETRPQFGEEEPYAGRLKQIRDKISTLFGEVEIAHKKSDSEKARAIVKESFEYQKLCDQNVQELLKATPTENHVPYALLSRFFKRILAHLSNIATSIFMPVTKLDFFDEPR